MDRLTPAQIRGARNMLGWSMINLAKAAGLSVSTVKRMETAGPVTASDNAFATARTAFEAAGIRFLFDSGRAEGLWFDRG